MKKIISYFLPFTLIAKSGYDIAFLLNERKVPDDLSNKAEMILTNSKGKSRNLIMITSSAYGNKKQLIWFIEPKEDRGISFLKIEHEHKNNEMRMWLPAFKKVRRISVKKKGDAFMGSDLSYEDLTNRRLDYNRYLRLEDDVILDKQCYVIEITPKSKDKSYYSKHISWIDKLNNTVIKENSYNHSNEHEKEKYFTYVKKDEYLLLEKVVVNNLIKKHRTKMIFSEIKVNMGLDDDYFHEKRLRHLPAD